ncbi:MAG: bifunctional phosphoribosyl-AMP cyclohydrolase/phosphoribosyl-ATP diphosphatase HisIE [Syntrophomonadaceae bacterium]|jgi:phosphoribosyl-ATP pyrophosphohydrolase/phosphoribosyl-AMP cyclohydrolase|nr:bifunctional phosphoribosyl-AMP cyclohydrolase/phosphoribosyl-ATP diphosphatase HisIE [Syntrophomonadaceae bacterium]HAA09688.1 bifunctional phosphoribosyl-AMP cyclohydrolase/phosphoribosyl-ATP pyrophosphatase [Syntrophomonas sp.]
MKQLKFNEQGLIPAIVQDVNSGQVLMMAYMNQEALDKTVASGQTWFYSRSRQCLWKKGETSGNIQAVQEIRYDCDQDTLLVLVEQTGAACHTGHYSCFYRTLDGQEKEPALFDAAQVYQGKEGPAILLELMEVIRQRQKDRPEGSYTTYLFNEGIDKILKKVGEESAEVIIAAKNPDNSELIYEVGDMIYHLLVLLVEKGVDITEIFAELRSRR